VLPGSFCPGGTSGRCERPGSALVLVWYSSRSGSPPEAADATIADLFRMWQEAKVHDWQPTTARDYRSRCNVIGRDIGSMRLRDLDPLKVDRWLADMRRAGVGEGAIRCRVQALRAAISWGISRRVLRSNPVSDARPRVHAGRRSERPEPEQVVALLAAAKEESARAGLALRIAAVTGAREAEVVALQWDDVAGDRLRVGRQVHGLDGERTIRARTRSGTGRSVVLDPATVQAIRALRDEVRSTAGGDTTWMFSPPGDDTPPSPRWLYSVFCRAAARAGVPVGRKAGFVLHDLRHWSASTALRDGHDPVTVAARLGHSPETLLRVYGQEIENGQAGVAASLAARLGA
jgi:integrase